MKAQEILRPHILLFASVLLAAIGASGARAQNVSPLSGKLMPEPAAATTAVPAPKAKAAVASAPAPPLENAAVETSQESIRVGDVTRTLLQAQADGRVAGPRLPMLGVTADASWQRYLDSFRHPLPEFFETKINKN
ncbi:DUF3613 domain-containing protein [Collimonas sp.]|jgi:hypothetical protein|uniref:DUF3613 domain-containing protein n=1 Tax=Collimonas sp. TaxID=1963772 RepID=UPI002BC581FB|nr:DUF3613 domain-containing protein [Collimonas sp.]HWW06157.1 DUF3613 domain-containing protein [Collimonas sp.]